MTEETLLEFEQVQSRTDVAVFLRSLTEQLDGELPLTLTIGEQSATVNPQEQLTFEIEIEREQAENESESECGDENENEDTAPSEISIELELTWDDESDNGVASVSTPGEQEPDTIAATDDTTTSVEVVESRGQFQIYKDRANEWRWRLVHRNGNIIATSGEGYTSRHNAEKGMHSVMQNAPGAEIVRDE